MAFFFFGVCGVKRFFLEHDELPFHCIEHVELDFIDFVFRFGVDEEIFVVEERVDQEVGTILDIVYFSC